MNLSVKSEDVIHAAQTLRSRVVRTPVLQSDELNHQLDAQVYFKCENLQTVGAFKFRGACYALSQLTESERQRGVIAFSSGNHAQAISKAAAEFNIPSLVVMPADAPQSKIKATRSYGAEVILYDRQREDREAITARLSQSGEWFLSHRTIIPGSSQDKEQPL
jgi:threonine dehydratase